MQTALFRRPGRRGFQECGRFLRRNFVTRRKIAYLDEDGLRARIDIDELALQADCRIGVVIAERPPLQAIPPRCDPVEPELAVDSLTHSVETI